MRSHRPYEGSKVLPWHPQFMNWEENAALVIFQGEMAPVGSMSDLCGPPASDCTI